jgi:hypothetical protein
MNDESIGMQLRTVNDRPVRRLDTARIVAMGKKRRNIRRGVITAIASLGTAVAIAQLAPRNVQITHGLDVGSPKHGNSLVIPWRQTASVDVKDAEASSFGKDSVRLELVANNQASKGERYQFVVVVHNTTTHAISMHPCPTYRVQYLLIVETGHLNCQDAPAEIPGGSQLKLEAEVGVQDIPEVRGGSYPLLWQFGGEAHEGATAVAQIGLTDH